MTDGAITWNRKYWDAIDQLYWDPEYLGFGSIPQKHWKVEDQTVSVPQELVNPDGPLYRRIRKAREHMAWMRRQEEILNHVFDIAFSIAPDALIETCLLAPLGFRDNGPFDSFGREVRFRYGWGPSANVTQQDGFFVSSRSIVGVELKLGASSGPAQIAKYLALMAWEEARSGRRELLGMLYIIPDAETSELWEQCRRAGPKIDQRYLDVIAATKLPKPVQALYDEHPDRMANLLDRLQLSAISWRDLHATASDFGRALDLSRPGDQTLQRLIAGLLAQIEEHVLQAVTEPQG